MSFAHDPPFTYLKDAPPCSLDAHPVSMQRKKPIFYSGKIDMFAQSLFGKRTWEDAFPHSMHCGHSKPQAGKAE